MDARSELLAYMGSALVTIAVLFGLQMWYASYLDVDVVHARSYAPLNPKVAEVRAQEQQKLASGRMPLAQAKAALAEKGRAVFPQIAPQPSDDLSAMSGWMQRPAFKPYEPRKHAAAAAEAPAVAEGVQPAAGQPAQPTAEATPAPSGAAAHPILPSAHPLLPPRPVRRPAPTANP